MSEQPAGPAPERSVKTGIAPIFVVGAVRSGTTLLRLMLNEHPDIAIPSESHLIGPLLRTFGIHAILEGDTLERALSIVLDCPEWQRDFGHTPAELRAAVGSQPLSIAEFLDRVFRLEVGDTTTMWGDKTPANMRWVGPLLECFPNAQVVAIVRDPRDVYLSLLRVKWLGEDPWTIGRYLAHSGGMLREWIASCSPERLHVLRYEDLVADSEATLRHLCTALGIEFFPSMVGFHVNTRSNVHQWELDEIHGKLLRPPESDDIARWRRTGSRLDRFEIEAMTDDVMRYWRYEHSLSLHWLPLLRIETRARHHLRHPRDFVTRNVGQLQRRVRKRDQNAGAPSGAAPPAD